MLYFQTIVSIKHDVMFRRNSPGGGTCWTSDNYTFVHTFVHTVCTILFGQVYQNAPLGAKFAIDDRLVVVYSCKLVGQQKGCLPVCSFAAAVA